MIRSRSPHPILSIDSEWEIGGLPAAISVMRESEEDALRLYYLMRFSDAPLRNVLCLARSTDGRNWIKPDLGKGSNIVMRSSGHVTGWGTFMPKRVIYEPQDSAAPWKMIYWERPTASSPVGICLATSKDGLDWKPQDDRPLIDSANDAASFTQVHPLDEQPIRNARYLLYQQTWRYNPDLPQDRDNLKGLHRRISLWHSPNFGTTTMGGGWIGPITILEPDRDDPPDLQHYWLTPFHTQSGYGGLLNCHHTIDQTMDVQLVTSDDGWTWRRENNRQPIVPLGNVGTFDCGMTFATCAPIVLKGETLIIYNGRSTVHDGALHYPNESRPDPDNGIGLAVVEDLDLLV